jgi:hypothetical protein
MLIMFIAIYLTLFSKPRQLGILAIADLIKRSFLWLNYRRVSIPTHSGPPNTTFKIDITANKNSKRRIFFLTQYTTKWYKPNQSPQN